MDIKNELNKVFRDIFGRDDIEIHDAMSAADIDEWDSITHISLVIATEDHFKVRLSTAEVAKLKNVGEMIQLLDAKLGTSKIDC